MANRCHVRKRPDATPPTGYVPAVAHAAPAVEDASPRAPGRAAIGAALFAVYVIWGSTYLGMRIALEAWPPLLLGGVRFTIAGTLLYVVLRARGTPPPTLRGWASAALVGVLMLTMGNGLVAFAQSRKIDSGVAATVIATMPMWMALLATVFGTRPSRSELAGLVLGFIGVALLQGGGSLHAGWAATAAIVAAPITWAFGSLIGLRLPLPKGLMSAAPQMLVGGVVMLALGALRGESFPAELTTRTTVALVYLIVIGSLIGFTAYGFLLRSTRTAVAASYAYVNPIVALALGALLAGEKLTPWNVMACGVIVLGVLVITLRRRDPRLSPAGGAPPPSDEQRGHRE